MSTIVIAGGSGLLGQALSEHFVRAGRRVVILGRRPSTPDSETVRRVQWSGIPAEKAQAWEEHLAGAEAVINMAGRSVNCRYTARNRKQMMDSRILSTRALGQALARCKTPPAAWLNSSTATIYTHTFGPPHDESGVVGATPEAKDAFSIEIATSWEREFFAAPVANRKVALRTAVVLSNMPGGIVRILARLARFGLAGKMGDGKQWVSWVHEHDFCRAVEFILAHPAVSGVVNIAAPNPVTNTQMMQAFRAAVGRGIGLPAARWMLEVGAFFLRTETELLIKSRHVISGRLPREGFVFEHPDFAAAVRDLIRQK